MAASLNEALLAIQKDQPDLKKDSKNPHFGNTRSCLRRLLQTRMACLVYARGSHTCPRVKAWRT
jgi:hypothetical protein